MAAASRGPRPPRIGLALRDPLPWHELVLTTETAEQTGYETLFVPEIAGREAFATLAGLARATYRIKLGAGVVAIDTRSPELIAMGAATVQEQARGRFVLGIGAGEPGPGSLGRLRTAIEFLRNATAGKPAAAGDESFELSLKPWRTRVPIWLAALGPKTMRLAGELADGVLLNWCTPERVAFAVQRVREGEEAAGRKRGSVAIGVYVRACVGQEEENAMPELQRAAAEYAAMPAYRRQLEECGLAAEARAAARAGDDPSAVPERLVREVCLLGEADEASSRLERYRAAGATMPVVYPVPCLDRLSSIQATILGLAPDPSLEFGGGPPTAPQWAVDFDYDLHAEQGE